MRRRLSTPRMALLPYSSALLAVVLAASTAAQTPSTQPFDLADESARKALATKVPLFVARGVCWQDVVWHLQMKSDANIFYNYRALRDAGLDLMTPVNTLAATPALTVEETLLAVAKEINQTKPGSFAVTAFGSIIYISTPDDARVWKSTCAARAKRRLAAGEEKALGVMLQDVQVEGIPLEDILVFLSAQQPVPVRPDWRSIQRVEWSDWPPQFFLRFNRAPLRDVLNAMCGYLQADNVMLDYHFRGAGLWVVASERLWREYK